MLIKVPVRVNLVLCIYPSYGPWKSLKTPWIWFWQMGKNHGYRICGISVDGCPCWQAPLAGSASCPSLREKAILLVKLSQHVEKRFPDDAELNAQFLELVYFVYRFITASNYLLMMMNGFSWNFVKSWTSPMEELIRHRWWSEIFC